MAWEGPELLPATVVSLHNVCSVLRFEGHEDSTPFLAPFWHGSAASRMEVFPQIKPGEWDV